LGVRIGGVGSRSIRSCRTPDAVSGTEGRSQDEPDYLRLL